MSETQRGCGVGGVDCGEGGKANELGKGVDSCFLLGFADAITRKAFSSADPLCTEGVEQGDVS